MDEIEKVKVAEDIIVLRDAVQHYERIHGTMNNLPSTDELLYYVNRFLAENNKYYSGKRFSKESLKKTTQIIKASPDLKEFYFHNLDLDKFS